MLHLEFEIVETAPLEFLEEQELVADVGDGGVPFESTLLDIVNHDGRRGLATKPAWNECTDYFIRYQTNDNAYGESKTSKQY